MANNQFTTILKAKAERRQQEAVLGTKINEQFDVLFPALHRLQGHMLNASTDIYLANMMVNQGLERVKVVRGSQAEKLMNEMIAAKPKTITADDTQPIGYEECKEFFELVNKRLFSEQKVILSAHQSQTLSPEVRTSQIEAEKARLTELIKTEFFDKHKLFHETCTPEEKDCDIQEIEKKLRAIPLKTLSQISFLLIKKIKDIPLVGEEEAVFKEHPVILDIAGNIADSKASPYSHLHAVVNQSLAATVELVKKGDTTAQVYEHLPRALKYITAASQMAKEMERDFHEVNLAMNPENTNPIHFSNTALAHIHQQLTTVNTPKTAIDESNWTKIKKMADAIKEPLENEKAQIIISMLRNATDALGSASICSSLAPMFKPPATSEGATLEATKFYGQLKTGADLLDGVAETMRHFYTQLAEITGKNENKWELSKSIETECPRLEISSASRAFAETIQFYCNKLHQAIAPYIALPKSDNDDDAPSILGATQKTELNMDRVTRAAVKLTMLSKDINACKRALDGIARARTQVAGVKA